MSETMLCVDNECREERIVRAMRLKQLRYRCRRPRNPKLENTISKAVQKMARKAGFVAIRVADEQPEQFHSVEEARPQKVSKGDSRRCKAVLKDLGCLPDKGVYCCGLYSAKFVPLYGLNLPPATVAPGPRSSQMLSVYVAAANGVAPACCSYSHGFQTI